MHKFRIHSKSRDETLQKQHQHLNQLSRERQKDIKVNVAHVLSATNSSDGDNVNRRLVEEFLFSKLEIYANKSRIWQITHSLKMKRRLIEKSQSFARRYSLSDDFVLESLNQFFEKIERYASRLSEIVEKLSQNSAEPKIFSHRDSNQPNDWISLQLQRAEEVLIDLDGEQNNQEEKLKNYLQYVLNELTPKPDPNSSKCIELCRTSPFDLDFEYSKAENSGKKRLKILLQGFRKRGEPDLDLIQEMVQHGVNQMMMSPTRENFHGSTNFLGRVSMLMKMKQSYFSGLKNMGDDFMLLRFGKIFGPNALPSTAPSNEEFIYLVDLFIRSASSLLVMVRFDEGQNEGIQSLLSVILRRSSGSRAMTPPTKLDKEEFFSPKLNIDQWTWLLEKWREALRTFPMLLTKIGAFSRLVRTTVGIGIARMYNFAEIMVEEKKPLDLNWMNEQLFYALQMGFYFGVAYAIVDCLQDEIRSFSDESLRQLAEFLIEKGENQENLSPVDRVDRWLTIMEGILTGHEYKREELPKTILTPLLIETFESLVTLTKKAKTICSVFNELALLLRSQRMDKKTPDVFYDDEELYLGAMLKSHFTYTCTTHLGNVKSAREESERLWLMPFLGQMTDDCRDFYDDVTSKSVTSFTHYASFFGREQTSSTHLINPFYVFLHLCSDIYISSNRDAQTGAFMGRRIIRTLKSIEISSGESALREFLYIFCQNNISLHGYCSTTLRSHFKQTDDPEKNFFRLINKSAISYARVNRKLETFVNDHLKQVENALKISSMSENSVTENDENQDEQLLLSAMNYSVKAGGKRLRPLLMMMASDLYGLEIKRIIPLARAIEYLHTSSLILDDLPAQDNSDLRRGRPTLHKATIDGDIPENLCEGRAQLAAVDLIAVSLSLANDQLVRNGFEPETVVKVVGEISKSMHDLCIGQMMDLRAARIGIRENSDQLAELDRIAWFKTGKAIEIGFISAAILAKNLTSSSPELQRLRELSRLMGILFQMRDDLLDIEGENIGKPKELDVKNNTVTYVSLLGVEETRRRLKEFQKKTLHLVEECWPTGAGTVKDVIQYIVERKN